MDLMKIAAQLFMNKLGSSSSGLDTGNVISALGDLLPTKGGQLDLGSLLGQLQGGNLAALVSTWLGDGANAGFSPSQLLSLLGQSKVDNFAGKLGLETQTAAQGLSDMIPELIDTNSKGGSLLDSVAGSGMLGSLAKGALGSLFK